MIGAEALGAMLGEGYRLLEALHESSNSNVVRVESPSGESLILKVLARAENTRDRIARYRQEFALSQQVGGDAIVRATSMGQHSGQYFIVFEDIGGTALRNLLAEGALPVSAALRYLRGAAHALATLHAAGITHNDVNPANLVWSEAQQQLQLIDLGIASDLPPSRATAAPPQRIEGTLSYVSPEQTGRTQASVDERSDLYALGATAFELLTGEPPFSRDTLLELVHAHLAVPAPDVRALRPEVPEALARVVAVLLAKDYGLTPVLVGAGEADQILNFLKTEGISLVLTETQRLPSRADDALDQPFRMPAILHEAGIPFAITGKGSWQQRNLPFQGGQAVGHGLPYEEAVRAMSLSPAAMLGLDERLGSLEVGKEATLFLSEVDALDMRGNQLTHAFIDGRNISLETHQTELWKRYMEKYEGK
jgi:serine/threonine protein kinase